MEYTHEEKNDITTEKFTSSSDEVKYGNEYGSWAFEIRDGIVTI
jgi:hypothetical protein